MSHESLWTFATKSFLGVSYLTNAIVETWVAAAGILHKKIRRLIRLLNACDMCESMQSVIFSCLPLSRERSLNLFFVLKHVRKR